MTDTARVVRPINIIRSLSGFLNALSVNVVQSLGSSIGTKDLQISCSGDRTIRSIARPLAPFPLIFALAFATTACAPIPCPGGYADPNWCNDEFVGGGG